MAPPIGINFWEIVSVTLGKPALPSTITDGYNFLMRKMQGRVSPSSMDLNGKNVGWELVAVKASPHLDISQCDPESHQTVAPFSPVTGRVGLCGLFLFYRTFPEPLSSHAYLLKGHVTLTFIYLSFLCQFNLISCQGCFFCTLCPCLSIIREIKQRPPKLWKVQRLCSLLCRQGKTNKLNLFFSEQFTKGKL